jgi:hypothetical protein
MTLADVRFAWFRWSSGLLVALKAGIVPCAEDRTVGAQAKGVGGTRRHRDDVPPTANLALPVADVSRCEHTLVRMPWLRRCGSCPRHHVFPLIDVGRSGRAIDVMRYRDERSARPASP